MENEREFLTVDVLSAASGFLLSDEGIGVVYKVLDFVTGESNFTHQLPRVGREFKAALVAKYPELAATFSYIEETCNRDTWREVAEEVEKRHGLSIKLWKLSEDEHESIDPMSELVEHVHPSKIITIGK